MANTRSKGKETDRRQSSRSRSTVSTKLMKRPGNSNLNSSSRNSDMKNSSSKNSMDSSPLRRSKRETPTKKVPQSSAIPQKSGPSTLTKSKLRKRNLKLSISPSPSGKNVSVVSSSSSKGSKKKSKGKKKVVVENNRNGQKGKNDDGDDDSNLSGNENTAELPKKRKRVLLHAKAYTEFFKPQLKKEKLSEDKDPKEKELESDRDENNKDEKETTFHGSPKEFVGEASMLRVQDSPLSSSKSSEGEPSPSPSKEKDTSEKDLQTVEIQVLSVPAESRAVEIDCKILLSPAKVLPRVPIEEKKMVICDEPQNDKQSYAANCCACKKPGTLLCCKGKGCKRSYHLTCLDPPIQETPPGIWLCIACVKKKIQFDVYSVSKGVESIWDIKDGAQNEKQYFVKYKNLAHVHNRWISETEVFRDTPELVSKFNWKIHKEKGQTTRWKQEWKEPERLLKRRVLMPDEMADEFFDGPADTVAYCNGEWLVKWRDLGYEHATWELENSEFLCKDDAVTLIRDFEFRRDQARHASDPSSACKALEVKNAQLNKLEKLPDGFPPGLDNDHLISTNKLREFWHKSQNAVFIDEQERLIKTILFIMSVMMDICRPILIVSNVSSLPLWESKFHCLAPNINVVTYTGTKNVRKLIQDVEFYEEGGCIMFQVLLSHPDAIMEDFEMIECVGWEAIIVDECQNFRMAKNLEKFKSLSTDFRLLLLSSQLKDIICEYVNILAYLDPNNNTGLPYTNDKEKASMLAILKERFARHVAYECKPDASKFMEYWVPVRMSNVQLELYASTLISNSAALRSFSKIDHVGALRDTLITLRKCCDHPYLVDQDLQGELMKERPVTEILNIGVRACGKLLLLDKLLKEMHTRGLRVLILFQAGGGSGRNQIGDFLDDFLRQRFGPESYEHVEKGLLMSKRQTAVNNFNDKTKGRFAFLIENRACLPSVKLSFVDAVLIYDSDWSPMNDLRALQRISIQPEPVLVPVFRFYSAFALEEKILILAKQDVFLDSNLHGVVPSVSHSLLSWGASYLLNSLSEPYNYDELISPDAVSFLDEVAAEILSKVSQRDRGRNGGNLLVEAQLSATTYLQNSRKLEGEKAGISSLEGDPNVFWSGLLEGTNPQWRFVLAEPAQRSRRKVQPFDLLDKAQGVGESDEARKKRRRHGDDIGMVGTGVRSPRGKTSTTMSIRNISCEELAGASMRPNQPEACVTEGTQIITQGDEDLSNLRSAQRGLHLLLKPQLLNLCGVAGLPDYVKKMAEMLLEYIMNNFKVDPEPESILQAFIVSLCWRSASLCKHWLDVGELVSLASNFLRYNCEKNHVESIYIRLKILNTEFKSQADAIRAESNLPVRSHNQLFKIPKQEVINLQEPSGEPSDQIETHQDIQTMGCLKVEPWQNRIDLIERVYVRRQNAILIKQQKELLEIVKYREREERRLMEEQQLHLKSLDGTSCTSDDTQVRNLKVRFERKMRSFEDHVMHQRKRLEAAHARTSELERNMRDEWVQNEKLGNLEESFDNVPLPDCGFRIEEFIWVGAENDALTEMTGDEEINSGERVINEAAVNGDETSNGETDGNEETNKNDETGNGVVGNEEMVNGETRNEEMLNGEMEWNTTSGQLVYNGGADQNISGEACERNADTEQETPAMEPTPPSVSVQTEPVPVTVQTPVSVSVPVQVSHTNVNATAAISDPTIVPVQQEAEINTVMGGNANMGPSQHVTREHDVLTQNIEPNSVIRVENGNGNGNARREPNSSPLLQMLPLASPIGFPQGLSPDPLRNELMRIKQQEDLLLRRYEYKKVEVEKEYAQELEKVRKKYEEIRKADESSYKQQKQLLGDVYKKVLINQSLAEEFRAKFIEHRSASPNASSSQGGRKAVPIPPRPQQVSTPPRPHQMSLPPRPHQVPQSTALQQIRRSPTSTPSSAPIATSNPTSTAASTPFTLPRVPLMAQLRPSTRPSPTPVTTIPTISAVRPLTGQTATSLNRSQFSPVTLNSLRPASSPAVMEHRAPAPHLTRFRPNLSSSTAPTNQSNPASAIDKLSSILASGSAGMSAAAGTSAGNVNVGASGQRNDSTLVPGTEARALNTLLAFYVNSTTRSTNNNISNNNSVNGHNNSGQAGAGQAMENGDGVVCLSDDD